MILIYGSVVLKSQNGRTISVTNVWTEMSSLSSKTYNSVSVMFF